MREDRARDERSRQVRAAISLWAMAIAMGGLAAAAHLTVLRDWAPIESPTTIPWWLLGVLFGFAELAVIHLQIQRDSHSLSLTEIPMVIGLALAPPVALISGRLVGSATALAFGRRQKPMKLAFNVGLFYLETVGALIVYRAILGTASPLDPIGWLASLAAIVEMVVLGSTLVVAAIWIHDSSKSLSSLLKALPMSAVISLVSALAGLLGVFALAGSPWSAVILSPGGVLLVAILRSYGVLMKRHDDLQAIHAFVQEGEDSSPDRDQVIRNITEGIITATKASACYLAVVEDDQLRVQAEEGLQIEIGGSEPTQIVAEISTITDLQVVEPGPAAAGELRRTGIECAHLVRIDTEGNVYALLVGPRVGREPEYGVAGKALIETLAASAAARLRRLELIDRLRAEAAEKQEIIRSKDDLIASVSHELRTPMTSVLGFADVLQSDSSDLTAEERLEMLGAIVDQSLDITNIVNDLLTVARSDTGTLTVQPRAIDLYAETIAVLESRAVRDVGMVRTVGGSTPAIADPERVRQVLRNLIVNATRYGGDHMRVEVAGGAEAAFVRVIDDGPGVDPALLERIFEPYVRTRGSTSQPASVGLGLTISRRLALIMGGNIEYRREAGETIFELSLPVAAAVESAA